MVLPASEGYRGGIVRAGAFRQM